MHSFTTERLLIRPLTEEDKAVYLSLYTNAKVMRHIGEPLTIEAAEKAFARSLKANIRTKKTVFNWAIVNNGTKDTIGIQALSWQTPSHAPKPSENNIHQVEIGITLVPKFHGKCFPEEAMGALMEYAFYYLSVERINAFYARKNLATKRFIQKLNFVFDEVLQPKNCNNAYQYCDKAHWQKAFIEQVL